MERIPRGKSAGMADFRGGSRIAGKAAVFFSDISGFGKNCYDPPSPWAAVGQSKILCPPCPPSEYSARAVL